MKNSFNFLQVANWVYIIRTKLKELRVEADIKDIPKQEILGRLALQKHQLELIKNIIIKKNKLLGIQPDFLKNLEEIKKQFGIEE